MVFLDFCLNLLIRKLQFIEDVADVGMSGFVLPVPKNSLEVPVHRFGVLFLQFVVDSDVVVTGRVKRRNICAFFVPFNCLIVILLCSPIHYSDLVSHSCKFGMSLGNFLKPLNLQICVFFVSGQHKHRHSVTGI